LDFVRLNFPVSAPNPRERRNGVAPAHHSSPSFVCGGATSSS
jgi:hypothetical protein